MSELRRVNQLNSEIMPVDLTSRKLTIMERIFPSPQNEIEKVVLKGNLQAAVAMIDGNISAQKDSINKEVGKRAIENQHEIDSAMDKMYAETKKRTVAEMKLAMEACEQIKQEFDPIFLSDDLNEEQIAFLKEITTDMFDTTRQRCKAMYSDLDLLAERVNEILTVKGV